ncbi:MAG TPA: C25 family cysteine peptidase [Acidobacteriota bacterium]|nr:C25 family cysteine peptidase [Acidobacteriota bacterium]
MVRSSVRLVILVLGVACLASPSFAFHTAYEVTNEEPVRWDLAADGFLHLDISSDIPLAAGVPDPGWRTVAIPEAWPLDCDPRLTVLDADTLLLPHRLAPLAGDWITSDTATPPPLPVPDQGIYSADRWFPEAPVRIETSGRLGGSSIASLSWCPLRYNPVRGELIVIHRAVLTAAPRGAEPVPAPATDTVPVDDVLAAATEALLQDAHPGGLRSPAVGLSPDWVWPDDPPLGVSYVVVTASRFSATMRPLVEWKARRGIAAGLATVEAIIAAYPGVDAAAAVRAYLQAAYGQGLQWVVLAGDETVLPVRYAYAGFESDPGGLENQQICDLYFADLSGNWDADGDGIYGEFIGDNADLYGELYVGRLPFSTADEAVNIIDKIIAYEAGPASADYLTRTVSVAADQMRDWSDGVGQHTLVASGMPSGWTHDLSTMVENPSGEDLQPSSPEATDLPGLLSTGAGFANYYVHGNAHGFVVRSPGILESPLSWVLTFGSSGDGNGHLTEIAATGRPGVHLSAACNQGAFDMDAPALGGYGESVAERLLFTRGSGAVAFVGQSRWGWVATSYKLIAKFYAYVNQGSIPNHVGVYQALAKAAFPAYRDLNFGNNLYGDPEMPVWKSGPQPLAASMPSVFTPGAPLGTISAFSGAQPVAGALVTIAAGDSVWTVGTTDGSGVLDGDLLMPLAGEVIVTVSKSGYRIYSVTVPVSIIADIFDEESTLPTEFILSPNYPNPFNAGTVIPFSLEAETSVALTVYDILGRPVNRLIDGLRGAGSHLITFDGTDDRGRPLATGVYFARLVAEGRTQVRKMVLLR